MKRPSSATAAYVSIRDELPGDRAAIHALNREAFSGDAEADLVESLRAEDVVVASLVASEGNRIVGHILFTELPISTDAGTIRGVALAPMAVQPGRQRLGIGSRLVRAGIEACRRRGVEAIVVLGHPDYYPRFGFSAEAARPLSAPFSGEAFMALALVPGALSNGGTVRYAASFGLED